MANGMNQDQLRKSGLQAVMCLMPMANTMVVMIVHIGGFQLAKIIQKANGMNSSHIIDYGPKTAFTEETLNTIKESLPFIAPAIDVMKEPVEGE